MKLFNRFRENGVSFSEYRYITNPQRARSEFELFPFPSLLPLSFIRSVDFCMRNVASRDRAWLDCIGRYRTMMKIVYSPRMSANSYRPREAYSPPFSATSLLK